ncbi:MAG: nucleotide disphospho-sugar-binding domain-containing protein [Pseudomonadota bacterium]
MAARLLGPLVDEIAVLAAAWRADVIVADSVAIVAGPIAKNTNAAWITIAASPVSVETRRGTPGFLGGWFPRDDWVGQVRDAVGRGAIRGAKRLVHRLVRAQVQDHWPVVYRCDGTEAIYAPDAILGLGLEALEFPRDWPAGFAMIGPLFGPPEGLPPLPLAQGKPRALLTAGTHLPWARSQWEQGARALAAAYPDIDFVLSLGQLDGGSVRRLTENLLAVPAVCYHRDLALFDVIVHHGGTGILYAALAAGKPSMVVPMDYDQPDYAARIVWHGLGLQGRHPGDTATFGQVLRQDWPACQIFQDLATAAKPEAAFLAALAQIKRSA